MSDEETPVNVEEVPEETEVEKEAEEDELLHYWEEQNAQGAVADTAYTDATGVEAEVEGEEKEKKEKEEKFKPDKKGEKEKVVSAAKRAPPAGAKTEPQPPIVLVDRPDVVPVAPGLPTGYLAPPAWALPGVHAVPLYPQAGHMRPYVPPVAGGEPLRETAKHAFTGEPMRQKIPLEVSHADTDEVWHLKLPTVWHEGLEHIHSFIVHAANKASNAGLTTIVDLEYQDDEGDFVRVGSTTHLYHELTRAYALRAVVR